MSPVRRLFIGAIVIATAAIGYAAGRYAFRPSERVVQPIAFNHKKHVEEVGAECSVCHENCLKGDHAGLPTLATCQGCHEEGQGDNPELKKIAQLAAQGRQDVFRKLFRLPRNVFYTHRRHAGIAGLQCATCHSAIAGTTEPPQHALVRITMDFCLDCHRRQNVSPDCTRCHR